MLSQWMLTYIPHKNTKVPNIFKKRETYTPFEFENPCRYPFAKVNDAAESEISKGIFVVVLSLKG